MYVHILTKAIDPARKERTGNMEPTTSASFQLRINAITKPAIKVVKYCMKTAALSPMPA